MNGIDESSGADMHAMRVMEARNTAYRILYDTVLDVEGHDDEVVSVLCRNLCRLGHAQWAAVAIYEPATNEMTLEAVTDKEREINTISSSELSAVTLPAEVLCALQDVTIQPCIQKQHCLFELFKDTELYTYYQEREDLAYYSLSCTYEGELVAWFALGIFKHQKLRLKDIIETYLYMAGMIIQRIKRTRALRIAHARNEQLLCAMSTILIVIDPQGIIRRWNRYAEECFGLKAEVVVGNPFDCCEIDWNWPDIKEYLKTCQVTNQTMQKHDVRFRHPETDQPHFLSMTVNPYTDESAGQGGMLIVAEDRTRQRILEQQVLQAQKLKSISRLACSVAHEINTPAQFINDNIQFLCNAVRDTQRLITDYNTLLNAVHSGQDVSTLTRELTHQRETMDMDYIQTEMPRALEQTTDGIERIAAIINAMKEFSCHDHVDVIPTNINQMVEHALTVSRGEWDTIADVMMDLDPRGPIVACNSAELNHVLLNMVQNAARAIELSETPPQVHKGQISVKTRLGGEEVEISISDTGCGIPDDVKSHIYDPFFTTQACGPNLGQGLAEAFHVIVEKHKGQITCDTRVGQGTTFTISLPRR